MSIVTQDLRAAGLGNVLDAIEAAEAAAKKLIEPGGATEQNLAETATATSAAVAAATGAVIEVKNNPVAAGEILVGDAISFLVPIIQTALTKKAASTGFVPVTSIGSLVTDIQALIGKL